MIDLARVGNNALVVIILFGVGYMIAKGKNSRLKDKLIKFVGVGKE